MKLFLFTTITMIFFAANSVFGRVALSPDGPDGGAIDPASYTLIRLAAGALVLAVLVAISNKQSGRQEASGTWVSAAALFGYAGAFSYAYILVNTGIGALILFACVQGTMIGWSIRNGHAPSWQEWTGLGVALAAFIWFVSPGLSAPDPLGSFIMALSGIAWGIYSIRGAGSPDPLRMTAGNFSRAVPMALVLLAIVLLVQAGTAVISPFGALMALCSGGISSALGYALWYRTLRGLTGTQAAIVQLTVPVLAGVGGTLFLGEDWTMRFTLASTFILGGVAFAIFARTRRT